MSSEERDRLLTAAGDRTGWNGQGGTAHQLQPPRRLYDQRGTGIREESRLGAVLDDVDNTERSKREVEAEAVVYVVGRYCGLDTSGSAFKLGAWKSDDPEVVRERLGLISRTAEDIIDILEK